ncbi:hypothetical protein HHL28_17165 [Aerophototrophica crusticola]|uniref:Uncharacterized protein n=1 Tax=Aerophototrophica crusticola TaxID=1709002 RepID=A0A858RBM5_9PROT|nr:hypothetical protein HHL28_17165 [Rhodospirillaceae bacterium B3]
MAGLTTPVLATLGTLNNIRRTATAVRSLRGSGGRDRGDDDALLGQAQELERRSLAEEQAEEQRTQSEELQRESDRIALEAAEDERRRQRALRRAVGRTRAQLGGQGISTADGSGEAILLGLARQDQEDRDTARQLDTLRRKALTDRDQSLTRRNLLERTRLEERQRLERLARGY